MVREAARLTFGPHATDVVEGINVSRMRAARAAKARQALRQHGLPAALVSGTDNVRYLAGIQRGEFQPQLCYLLFFAEHDPVVFAHAGCYHQLPDQCQAEVLTVEIGHGVGLVNLGGRHAHYNRPVINRQWSMKHPQVFEPGMVIAVESLEGEHRVGGVRLENMAVVTERGAEIIDFFPRDEILVAGV